MKNLTIEAIIKENSSTNDSTLEIFFNSETNYLFISSIDR